MTRTSRLVAAAVAVTGCVDPATPDSAITCDIEMTHPRATELQAIVDRPAANGIPGLGVAVKTPDGIWAGAAGFADIENGVAMTPCHVHSWESVAKTWYATLALRLADAGQLEPDGQVADVLPAPVLDGLANTEDVSLREMMQHVSGIPDFNDQSAYLTNELDDPDDDDTPMDLLDFVRGQPAHFEIGEEYRYSDTNFVLLALAIDEITGDRSDAMAREIFVPLGLEHTWAPLPGDPVPAGRVNSYWELPGGQLENVSDYQAAYDVQVPGGGGLLSTPLDSLTFVDAIVSGTLLEERSYLAQLDWTEQSVQWADERGRDNGYAYGLGTSRRIWTQDGVPHEWAGHTGGGAGTTAIIMARRDGQYAVAVAINLGGFLGGPLNELVDESWIQELIAAAETDG